MDSEDWINHKIWRNLITQTEFFIGIFAVWSSYDFIATRSKQESRMPAFIHMAFFIFAAHEPILTILKKLTFAALGKGSESIRLATYFIAPLATILICILVGYVLRKWLPNVFSILTGGRVEPTTIVR
ncbi:MAG: hypothetical protein HC892_05345 [Saprospiraceae bacterium]|nr:hypothetical protein [Saprospiraceae bacterium]